MKLVATTLAFTLLSCGKEAGRIPFAAEGAQQATVSLAKGDVAFWTDIDLEFKGDASLSYSVTLLQNGAQVTQITCNPLGHIPVKTSWVQTDLGASHSRRGNGKMACGAVLPNAGPTEVRASLAFGRKPESFTLKRADLVVKQ